MHHAASQSPIDPRIARALRTWLGWGIAAVLLLPFARPPRRPRLAADVAGRHAGERALRIVSHCRTGPCLPHVKAERAVAVAAPRRARRRDRASRRAASPQARLTGRASAGGVLALAPHRPSAPGVVACPRVRPSFP